MRNAFPVRADAAIKEGHMEEEQQDIPPALQIGERCTGAFETAMGAFHIFDGAFTCCQLFFYCWRSLQEPWHSRLCDPCMAQLLLQKRCGQRALSQRVIDGFGHLQQAMKMQ